MNRQRFVDRDFEAEGSERSARLAAALAQTCDPEFLEALIHHKAALDEFGGEVYIAASPRPKFNRKGERIEVNEPGNFETLGYIFHFGHRARYQGAIEEPDTPYGGAVSHPSSNGDGDPESVRDEVEAEADALAEEPVAEPE